MKKRTFSYFLNWMLLGLIFGFAILVYQGQIELGINKQKYTTEHNIAPVLSYSEAVALAAPSVVYIQSETYIETPISNANNALQRLFGLKNAIRPKTETITSSGSGVILDSQGYILTNHHVIHNADEITIILYNGQKLKAEMVGKDIETDLAVLKINADNLPKIKIANVMSSKIGDIVLAIGYPYAIGQTVTQGIISATGRKSVSSYIVENFIQTDAAINPGNSGGALINASGEIIGINSLIYTKTGSFQGISFAIPIDLALDVLQQIKINGHVARGWAGITGREASFFQRNQTGLTAAKGIYIDSVDFDGPAHKAGLKPKDIITHVNKKAVSTNLEFRKVIAKSKPGEVIDLLGLRKQQSFMSNLTLGERPMVSQQ